MAIGHNRYSTTGSSFLRNAQPFRSESILGPIVLAHNGNLTNAGALRYDLEKKGHIFQTTIDSEVIVHLMAKSGIEDFLEALIFALQAGSGRLLPPGHEPRQDLRGARPLRVPPPGAGQARHGPCDRLRDLRLRHHRRGVRARSRTGRDGRDIRRRDQVLTVPSTSGTSRSASSNTSISPGPTASSSASRSTTCGYAWGACWRTRHRWRPTSWSPSRTRRCAPPSATPGRRASPTSWA